MIVNFRAGVKTLAHRRLARTVVAICVGVVITLPVRAQAQTAQRDSAVATFLGRASDWLNSGTGSYKVAPSEFLRRLSGAQASVRMDSLADGITGMIIAADTSRDVHARAVRLLSELQAAGIASGDGVPYSGAMDKMILIATSARDFGTRRIAMFFIAELPDRRRGLQFLRGIAVAAAPAGQSLIPSTALGVITGNADRGDTTALRIARELWDRKLVVDEQARWELEGFATIRGWKG